MYAAAQAELDQFRDQGFFCRESVFSESELEELRDVAENVHAQILAAADRLDAAPVDRVDNQRYQSLLGSSVKWEWSDELRAVRSMEPTHHLDARLDALIDDPRLWEPCRSVIGTRGLSLFSDKLNVKRPGGAPFPWHQEGPYWAYGAECLEKIVSVLIYLDEATKENGCFWVIPGSHRHGPLASLQDRGVLGALYTDVDRLEGEPLAFELAPGSAVFFHHYIVHGSQTNRTHESRRIFLLAYQPEGLQRWRINQTRPVPST